MLKYIFICLIGLVVGLAVGDLIITKTSLFPTEARMVAADLPTPFKERHSIGFLPYWLLEKADTDYSDTITTLTYFGLTLDEDGSILKLMNEQETEPGWHTLNSGSVDSFLEKAKAKNMQTSLLVFAADQEAIDSIMKNPEASAKNLIDDVVPIMKKYDFTDLNIDIESVLLADEASRRRFTRFIKTINTELDRETDATLTVEVSPTAFIKDYLIDAKAIEPYIDYLVVMAYDYHYPGSSVTGPVAPLGSGGEIAEFDTIIGIEQGLTQVPASKLILGIPSYGYEWETIADIPRAAVIPGTGVTASSARVEKLLKVCDDCEIQVDENERESYIIYPDPETDVYHQIFYPDKQATQAKIEYAQKANLAGLAIWALGYEDASLMEPLKDYIK